ncbi:MULTISPECIES: inorganic diphosphatase [Alcaligenaceae]|uniref:Inorganic pyrophosphatase n=1 Tax=Eoetvoesiella caeni TaxID=645616 RepID=A0A366H519_9BURK|nr:inorganic diphosphatase [Eoetvoesiella caeni]MCI2810337.1 inorganic diphosphatase [Eoetvoesiella caeni]NYT54706.1 inorganic diphosphatase [Eoetvoesiella caeni]RBP37125.1 inorganic pyrophosphatase [Eoetvoesiella caeni]
MSYKDIPAGSDIPDHINVYTEIPAHGLPIKYELNKASGEIFVDRFLSTSMAYPANYGFIPNTLSEDGDPLDALVISPYPVAPGVTIPSRTIGVMLMTDEHGPDAKIIAVPDDTISQLYRGVRSCDDLPPALLDEISHFFANYKTLEPGKWVKVEGWGSLEQARAEILKSADAHARTGTHGN